MNKSLKCIHLILNDNRSSSSVFISLAATVHKIFIIISQLTSCFISQFHSLLTVPTMSFHEHSFSCAEENMRKDNRKNPEGPTPSAALPPEDS